jgi:hypothetical protein
MAFSSVFRCFARVSDTSFKCFICLHTYVANVASGYFKNSSGVVAMTHQPQ